MSFQIETRTTDVSAVVSPATADVSVLLPSYNRAAYIHEAIRSVLGQTRSPREIIVIDDGSTDETEEVCATFGDRIRYVRQSTNRGKTAAINRGVALALGAFIWVMDDDDIAPPNAIADLLAPLEKEPTLGFSFGRLRKFTQNASGEMRLEEPQSFAEGDRRSLFIRLMEDCFITGQPCTLIRKRCLDAIGPLDEGVRVSVDNAILLELARRFEAVDVGTVVLLQRQHDGLRGPASLRYGEQDRVKKWMESDARLISRLLETIDLAELCGLPRGSTLSATLERRAHLQAATIAARKSLWEAASKALAHATRAAPDAPLEQADRIILRLMLGSRYGIDGFIENSAVQDMISDALSGARWRDAAKFEISSRLTFWIGGAIRNHDRRRFTLTARSLVRLAGAQSLSVAFMPLWRRLERRANRLNRTDCTENAQPSLSSEAALQTYRPTL